MASSLQLRSSARSWGAVTRWLHWLVALLVVALMVLGWFATEWPLSPTKIKLFFWHKSIGMLVLILVLVRLCWRLWDGRPDVDEITATERRLARLAHLSLYVLLIAMPLSGWVINSAGKFPFAVFGVIPLPAIVAPNEAVEAAFKLVHLTLFWILATLVVVHVGAALRHHFVAKNNVLRAMLFPDPRTSDYKEPS